MNVETIVQFSIGILLPILATIVFHTLGKNTSFGRWGYWQRQIAIGVVFGGIAILGTEFGVVSNGATLNVRDAAPLTAGLLFGGPSGVIAGLIGGVERWFAALWGRGMFTRLACSVATVAAGFYALIIRRVLFDNKRPTWPYAFATGIVVEVLHLMLIFLTHMHQVKTAFIVVSVCTVPMLVCNGLSVALSCLAYAVMEHEPLIRKPEDQKIADRVQSGMAMAVAVALIGTSAFTYDLQNNLAESDTQLLLLFAVSDVTGAVSEAATTDLNPETDDALTDAEYRASIASTTHHRHLDERGVILVANEEGEVISTSDGTSGYKLSDTGLQNATAENAPYIMFSTTYMGSPAWAMYGSLGEYDVIAVLPMEEAYYSRDVSALLTAHMSVLILAALFIVIFFLIKHIVVDNINKINSTLDEITGGNLEATVDVHTSQEFSLLSGDINDTVAALKHFIDEEAARIDSELEYARKIQNGALPTVFPPFPSHKEFDIFASMSAAKEVGGDFYDFFLVDDEHLAFLIADVSGKGIPAALFMMTSKRLIKTLAESGLPVEQVLARANDELCQDNDAEMFVTVWMGILDLSTGHMHFTNAGHNPPALCRAGETFSFVRTRPNLVLAELEGIPYRSNEMDLFPGDTLFLYTDGVTEATDTHNELFEEERLLASLNKRKELSLDKICAGVHSDVDAFVGEGAQFDDITVLILRYKGME